VHVRSKDPLVVNNWVSIAYTPLDVSGILGPVVAAMPFTHFIAASKGADWLWLSICVLMMLKYASSTMGMASVNLMVRTTKK
jgi:hypothetical protein